MQNQVRTAKRAGGLKDRLKRFFSVRSLPSFSKTAVSQIRTNSPPFLSRTCSAREKQHLPHFGPASVRPKFHGFSKRRPPPDVSAPDSGKTLRIPAGSSISFSAWSRRKRQKESRRQKAEELPRRVKKRDSQLPAENRFFLPVQNFRTLPALGEKPRST